MAFQLVFIRELEPELKLFDKFLSTYDKDACNSRSSDAFLYPWCNSFVDALKRSLFAQNN